ncbi:MAG: DUF2207 domain-containing protein [Actinomycetales bacterium]|nr:DUF2207 domain-containing protein [Actinomycetales bacterium]
MTARTLTKRLYAVLLLTLGLAGGTAYLMAPRAAAADSLAGFVAVDTMPEMTSDFVLDRTGAVDVTETIRYSFDAALGERHGIYRNIVVRQGVADQPEAYRYYAMTGVSVTSPTGANANVALTDNGSTVTIKIGSANVTVRGTQTYIVKYRLANVVNDMTNSADAVNKDTAEFYYNVFTSDPISKAAATINVRGPGPATATRCTRGEVAPCDQTGAPGQSVQFRVANLNTNEDLTIALAYPRAVFGELKPDIRTGGSSLEAGPARLLTWASYGGGVLAPLLALLGMGSLVATRGRDEWYAGLTPGLTPGLPPGAGAPPIPVKRGKTPTVAVQFAPPPGVQPGLVGTIIDESADTIDVSATVIDLAVRGYLQIEELPGGGMFARTDWKLTLLRQEGPEPLRPYEQSLLNGIFSQGNPVTLSDLKNTFAQTLATVKSQMYGETLSRRWFRSSPDTTRNVWRVLSGLLVGGGIMSAFFWGTGSRAVDRTAGVGFPIPSGIVLGLGLALAGVIVGFFGNRMAAKTAEGSAVYAQSLGFKQYLVTAEAGQIRWEEAQDIFSRYLPYAIVFGVADKWANTFQQVAAAAAAAGQQIMMPSWYIYQGSMFPDFSSITNGVDSFSTTASGTFQSTPGSSGGSGFGSSGGSFSGGGIGGSSSGSW